ncbi:MAG TPA: Ig-like domain-containing protein, partial [Bryobacteraceae bacterium]|nr:Ig-like domain-containing protein [Bryobacteraceae bacterium]
TYPLPFDFPFFSKTYRSMTIYPTGALGFGFSAFTSLLSPGCNDSTELARLPAVAPLFANLTFGTAQPNEGIYSSASGPGSLTIRWAAETLTPFPAGEPVNFAVTLTKEGVIQFFYGAGNTNFTTTLNGSACGQSPVIGISNGHEAFTQTVLLSTLNNALSLRFEPPFNFTSVPVGTIERPARGETVQGVLTVRGVAYDSDAAISRVDIFIDGVERAVTGAALSRPDFCAQQNVRNCPFVGYQTNLDLAALGLAPGPHDLRIRVTNTRGSLADFPDAPVSFTVDPAPGRLPKGAIESPAAGATISGTVQFRGYAYFDDLLVRRVDLLIDGLTYPSATYGLTRTDICNALAAPKPPNCNNVGWTVTFNTRTGIPPLPDGPHGMQLRVLDEAGRFTLLPDAPIPIVVKNGPQTLPVGALTSPKPNDHLSGTVTISGYAYSPGGQITSVFVLLDGQGVALASYGAPRPDECAQLTGVEACPNIGFSATFDTRTVPNGPHVLGVLIRNDQGLSIVTPQFDADGMNVTVDNP